MDRGYGPSCFLAYGKDRIAAFMISNTMFRTICVERKRWIRNCYWIFVREGEGGIRFVLSEVISL